MKNPARYCALLAFLLLILSNQTFPQTNIPEKIQFKHITKEQGLSDNFIWCMLQDSKGFLWIGSPEGLKRYDGRNFKIYKNSTEDAFSLGSNSVRALYEDRSGVLWVGTGGGGLNRYNATEKM